MTFQKDFKNNSQNNSNFILGPFQKEWLNRLESFPERQHKGRLGRKTDDGYKACCIGEAALVCGEGYFDNIGFLHTNSLEVEGVSSSNGLLNYNKMGLFGPEGPLKDTVVVKGETCGFLSVLNDLHMTWPEIAAYIRANPENVFEKSC